MGWPLKVSLEGFKIPDLKVAQRNLEHVQNGMERIEKIKKAMRVESRDCLCRIDE